MVSVREKQRNLTDYIQKQIYSGSLAPDDKIPPLRDLMGKFDIRYTSANKAINTLVVKGLLEVRVGSGTFVKKSPLKEIDEDGDSDSLHIAVFIGIQNNNVVPAIQSTVFFGLQEAAIGHNCVIEMNYMSKKKDLNNNVFKYTRDADAIIMLGEYDNAYSSLDVLLPVVGVCIQNNYSGLTSNIDIDPFSVSELACDYFNKKQKKHIHIMSNNYPSYKMHAKWFAAQWENYGTVEYLDYMGDIDFDPDGAYFFVSGSMLQYYSEITKEKYGKTLAEYTTVLGVDGKSLINPDFHHTPTITTNWKLAGQYALEEAILRINTPGTSSRRVLLLGKLVE